MIEDYCANCGIEIRSSDSKLHWLDENHISVYCSDCSNVRIKELVFKWERKKK